MKIIKDLNEISHFLNKINIIVGTSTNIGKTFTTIKLIETIKKNSKSIFAIKPILSGFNETDFNSSDSGLIFNSLFNRFAKNKTELQIITKYLLNDPISPNLAARNQKVELSYYDIITFCKTNIEQSKQIIIETAGGIMSPLTNHETCLNLTNDLKQMYKNDVAVIMVTSDYLGSVSHTLTALLAIKPDILFLNRCSNDFIFNIENFLKNTN